MYEELDDGWVDVYNDEAGIVHRLKWELSEKEVYLYESELTGAPLMLHEPLRNRVTRRLSVFPVFQRLRALAVWLEKFPCDPGPNAPYTEWLEVCPIARGGVQFTTLRALKGRKGRHPARPLGILSGAGPHMQCSMVHPAMVSPDIYPLGIERIVEEHGGLC